MSSNEEEFEYSGTPPSLVEAARCATQQLLPEKSKSAYEKEYDKFVRWCTAQNTEKISENVLLAYFLEKSKNYKGSSLWTFYSMLKSKILIEKGINISKFSKLIIFLKRKAEHEKPKKSKVLKKEEVYKFIKEAPDETFLMAKVQLYNFLWIILFIIYKY